MSFRPTKSIAAGLLLALIFVAAGCAASSRGDTARKPDAAAQTSRAPAGVESIQAPVLQPGDIWTDRILGRNHEFRILQRRKDGTLEVSFWGSPMTTNRDLNITTYRSLTDAGKAPSKLSEANLWFPFPLYEGKTWTQTFHWETMDGMSFRGKTIAEGKVGGWEQITVPAGKFRALRVDVSSRSFGSGGSLDIMRLTYWYVPAVKRFVKFDFQSNYEGAVQAEMVSYRVSGRTK